MSSEGIDAEEAATDLADSPASEQSPVEQEDKKASATGLVLAAGFLLGHVHVRNPMP